MKRHFNLPDAQNTLELQYLGDMICLLRHGDGRVTCPMGKALFKRTTRADGATDYYSREACRTCPNRCTQSKGTKTVRFGPDTVYVPVIRKNQNLNPPRKT